MADIVPQRPSFFNFDAQAVRVVGTPFSPAFVAKDVCEVLGIVWKGSGISGSLEYLDDDEKGIATVATLGGPQQMGTVNESGLYALIFRSRKPQAKLFRRWVTSEVLPAIRKTGTYSTSDYRGEMRQVEIYHKLEPLPPVPSGESRAAELLWAAIGYGSMHRSLTARAIARTAVERGFYLEIVTDAENHQQVAHLMRRLGRYFGTWLCAARGSGEYISLATEGAGRTRRYWITRRVEVPRKENLELRYEPIKPEGSA